ncbi:deaminase [Spiroplasma endosymbiont of Anurida maritima]|uniref:deaminase n=1 Tax=Spiroplasma endosymbiont of Anurida maritima TaxID=2967972 RepID=UPI0036D4242C
MKNFKNIKDFLQHKINKTSEKKIPIIAAAVKNNKIITFSKNKKGWNNRLKHAEINVINKCLKKKVNFSDITIYVNLEPCMMCMGAIKNVGISKIYYYVENQKKGFITSNFTHDISKMDIKKSNDKKINNFFKEKLENYFKKIRG